MIVGIPAEIKNNENRVSMTPAGVASLTMNGHKVAVQHNAGAGSGFSDAEYIESGAHILDTAEEVFGSSDMIVKVKEPQASEYKMLREGQLLFTYLHLASSRELTEA
ncbi:MAG TPA: alanine dehydrogenase, partial [Clostridia bacterium]|nr:alanine dehydrogenase [Clostridia bacterium]